jgi:hypothetical protein
MQAGVIFLTVVGIRKGWGIGLMAAARDAIVALPEGFNCKRSTQSQEVPEWTGCW